MVSERRTGSPDRAIPAPGSKRNDVRELLDDGAVEIPVDGVLDLHTFRPSEVGDLVPEYLTACLAGGIFRVRIIHGKGTGVLRRTVEAVLKRVPSVASFEQAGPDEGGWGATIVHLRKDGVKPTDCLKIGDR